MELQTLLELYGLPGLIIGGLAWWGRAERSERVSAQAGTLEIIRAAHAREVELSSAMQSVMRSNSEALSRIEGALSNAP